MLPIGPTLLCPDDCESVGVSVCEGRERESVSVSGRGRERESVNERE